MSERISVRVFIVLVLLAKSIRFFYRFADINISVFDKNTKSIMDRQYNIRTAQCGDCPFADRRYEYILDAWIALGRDLKAKGRVPNVSDEDLQKHLKIDWYTTKMNAWKMAATSLPIFIESLKDARCAKMVSDQVTLNPS